jgi:Zn-dependent protease
MPKIQNGALKLVHVLGIDVYVHWTWLLLAMFEMQSSKDGRYENPVWPAIEYLSVFGIVLLHEFGHALACRQVGGVANRIMLWPLGGVAYVAPPPRPGAWLWSIAAGPLVNVLLVPVTLGLLALAIGSGWDQQAPDLYTYLMYLAIINGALLVFNMLPIYPLDGGQILHSLLWFVIGRARSLMVASGIGLVGGAALVALAVWTQNIWLGVMAAFIGLRCFSGFQQARALAAMLAQSRHAGLACPSCGQSPLQGPHWTCGRCREEFDLFDAQGMCPGCGGQALDTECFACHRRHLLVDWPLAAPSRSA